MNGEIWFQLPPQDRLDWSITVFAAFIITFGGLYLLLDIARYRADKVTTLKRRLGFEQVSNGVFMIISLIWLTLLVTFVFATVVSVTSSVFELATLDAGAETALRGRMLSLTAMIAGLAAVAAFPITLIRMHHAARQTMVAEEQLFNEKLHEASKDLAAWREVTRVVGKQEHERVLTTREPDLVTRATAIDRLYGLIKERPSEASRIAAMLATYIVQTTAQEASPDVDWPAKKPKFFEDFSWYTWIGDELPEPRSDIQRAVTVLCQINKLIDFNQFDTPISLAGANLQKVSFVGQTISNVDFNAAHFQGAQVQGAIFRNCKFTDSEWQGTIIERATFETCDFSKANFFSAQFYLSVFCGSIFKENDWTVHNLAGCRFYVCQFDNTFDFSWRPYGTKQYASIRKMLPYGCVFPGSLIFDPSEALCSSLRDQFDSVFCRIFNVDFQVHNQPKHWITPTDSRVNQPEVVRKIWRDWVAENHPDVLQYLPDDVRNA